MADTYDIVTKYGALLIALFVLFGMLADMVQSAVASSSAVVVALIALLVIALMK